MSNITIKPLVSPSLTTPQKDPKSDQKNSPLGFQAKVLLGLSAVAAVGVSAYFMKDNPLGPHHLSEHDLAVLKVRDQFPEEYQTTFIRNFFNATSAPSAIEKTISLAAALGEAPTNLLKICADTHAGPVWCMLDQISSEENMKKALYKSKVSVAQQLFNQTPSKVRESFFEEYKKSPPVVRNRFTYNDVNLVVPSSRILRSERLTEMFAPNEFRSNFVISTNSYADQSTLVVERYPHESQYRKFKWNQFFFSCQRTSPIEFKCSTNKPLVHRKGELDYKIAEKIIRTNCSLITETLNFPSKTIERTYAINPEKQLPYFMPKFVNSVEFLNYKMNGKITIPTQFPKDLANSCEDL